MTATEIIIKCLDDNSEDTCRVRPCDLPEEEGNTGECCHKCAMKILAEHNAKVRADTIDEFLKALEEYQLKNCFDMFECEITFADIEEVAEQLKEKKNERM